MRSLKTTPQFDKVFKTGKSFANKNLIMYVLSSDLCYNRVGVVVSKKVGVSVTRSKVKRRIKECWRQSEPAFKTAYDVILIARPVCARLTYWQIRDSLYHLAKKHDIFINGGEYGKEDLSGSD